MDVIENIIGRLIKKPEMKVNTIWTDELFKNYAVALTRGGDFVELGHRFPEVIELNQSWHQTLGQIRRATENGREHWALIGFKDDQRAIYLPPFPFEAEAGAVPVQVMIDGTNWAYENHQIVSLIGDIHSHPFKPEDIGKRLNPKTAEQCRAAFSVGDLYSLVQSRVFFPIMGLVDGNENLFAFKTKATQPTQYQNQESFSQAWYKKTGFDYQGSDPQYGQIANPISSEASIWKTNLEIAKAHQIVIYRGFPGKNLERVTPRY